MDAPARPRLLPHIELPTARYVPGCTVEVARPEAPAWPEPLEPARWQACPAYLYGIDLFNHGYYWEAHEVWEWLWNQAGRSGPQADFLKALIKLAAAGVKHCQGNDAGRQSNARRAAELLTTIADRDYLGFAIDDLIELAAECARAAWTESPLLTPRFI
jgi:predicted metal-dependent hydrolase